MIVRNMKLYIEDRETKIEVKEIKELSKDTETVILFLSAMIAPENMKRMEIDLKRKFKGKNIVILDARFKDKLYGI